MIVRQNSLFVDIFYSGRGLITLSISLSALSRTFRDRDKPSAHAPAPLHQPICSLDDGPEGHLSETLCARKSKISQHSMPPAARYPNPLGEDDPSLHACAANVVYLVALGTFAIGSVHLVAHGFFKPLLVLD